MERVAKSPSEKIGSHSERVLYLGEYWTAAKPPSERVARHSVGFFKLRRVLDYR